jgi:branched-chain amino acid transport system ATP-binding protein
MPQTSLAAGRKTARALALPSIGSVGPREEQRALAASITNIETPLRIESVCLAFGGVAALRDISLTVQRAEIRAIIGPNGAGKSSLLNVISGVYRPQSGSVWLAGQSYAQVPTTKLASLGVARTFQNLALFTGLSVLDNIASGLAFSARAGLFAQIAGLPAARAEEREAVDRARQAIAFFHLEEYADRLAGNLSFGIRKRIELARAMVAQPHLLLLDEPMAGMARADKQELTHYIRILRDTYGTAIVLIEHDVRVVMELSDRIAVLQYGNKIADGIPSDIAGNQAVIDAYLGVAHDTDRAAGI